MPTKSVILDPNALSGADGTLVSALANTGTAGTAGDVSATGAARPALQTVTINGQAKRVLRTNGTQYLANTTKVFSSSAGFAFSFVCPLTSLDGIIALMGFGDANLVISAATISIYDGGGYGGLSPTFPDPTVYTVVFTGTRYKLYANGILYIDNPATTTSKTGFALGATTGGQYGYTGDIYYCCAYDAPLSDSEALTEADAIRAIVTIPAFASGKTAFIFAGNSLTASKGSGICGDYPIKTMAATTIPPADRQFLVRGVSSITTTQWAANAAHEIDARWNINSARDVLGYWESTNQIGDGAQADYDAIKAFLLARKTANPRLKTVLITMLPGAGRDNSIRAAHNALIMAGTTAIPGRALCFSKGGVDGIDYVVAIHQDPTIGANGANTNPTYFDPDQIHLNQAGDAVVAGYVAPLFSDLYIEAAASSLDAATLAAIASAVRAEIERAGLTVDGIADAVWLYATPGDTGHTPISETLALTFGWAKSASDNAATLLTKITDAVIAKITGSQQAGSAITLPNPAPAGYGGGLTNGQATQLTNVETKVGNLDGRLTPARAGYLDYLDTIRTGVSNLLAMTEVVTGPVRRFVSTALSQAPASNDGGTSGSGGDDLPDVQYKGTTLNQGSFSQAGRQLFAATIQADGGDYPVRTSKSRMFIGFIPSTETEYPHYSACTEVTPHGQGNQVQARILLGTADGTETLPIINLPPGQWKAVVWVKDVEIEPLYTPTFTVTA